MDEGNGGNIEKRKSQRRRKYGKSARVKEGANMKMSPREKRRASKAELCSDVLACASVISDLVR